MKAVFQTITESGKGDCYRACLASLLEVSIESIPNFRVEYPVGKFTVGIQDYLERFGLMIVRVRMQDSDNQPIDFPFHPVAEGALCIAGGKSPRGSHGHAVVGRITGGINFELLHDPNGEADVKGIEEIWTIDFLVPKDPASVIRRIQVGD
jgi:hypothetical protein